MQVAIAPTFIHLKAASKILNKHFLLSAQNMSLYDQGAYTGEISGDQLKDMNINWVILGHSERRTLFKEANDIVALKTKKAIEKKLDVIFCIGEKIEEREAGKTFEVCDSQLTALVGKIDPKAWNSLVIAYEPVWAIGTGKVATPIQAQEVHAELRDWLKKKISEECSKKTRIIYGGSVTEKNATDLNPSTSGCEIKSVAFFSVTDPP